MPFKEAQARLKINQLLTQSGWRFFEEKSGPANIRLEALVKFSANDWEALGENFEKASKGFIDFLLLDSEERPLAVLEAKAEDKNPLIGKEQARKYARAQNCRFVLLSNGNLHYFWDLERGNPEVISAFPTPESLQIRQQVQPVPQRLSEASIGEDYIVLTRHPHYQNDAGWRNEAERPNYIYKNKFRFLRPYQLRAIASLQAAVKEGKDRFLFEMATGTGKTLTAAAIIKLFLRSGNARRVLFLVDRLELEKQAEKSFKEYLSPDAQTVIYKENREDWRRAEIVVTTVQSLLFNNKYLRWFSPTDFDLVISDEAHRSIGGNSRAVFEYFIGYKLGLTATPRDYLKKWESSHPAYDPRELERRLLLDTYRTFGCENGLPTFRYSLLDGVKEGYLINPTVVDARTALTTQMLSDQGLLISFMDSQGEDQQQSFTQRDFEKNFFSEATNRIFCQSFLENALRAPISGETMPLIVTDPYRLAPVCELPYDSPSALHQKLAQAAEAFQAWRRVPLLERRAQVLQALDYFRQHAPTIAHEITLQMGKPLKEAQGEVRTMLDRAEVMSALAESALAPEALPPKPGFSRSILHEPLGVVLNIAAWNYPLLVVVNVVVPALLAGNAVVLKHSPLTPLCGEHFARAFGALSVPHLVTHVVLPDERAGELLQDSRIAHVAFTGSVSTGQRVYRETAAHRLIEVGLELGGKDPAYVAEDADLEFAVENIVDGACYNAGQSCCAVERVYVHRALYPRFLEAAQALLERYRLGDPLASETTLGPLARPGNLLLLERQVQGALAQGARLLSGGQRWSLHSGFFLPTLLADVPNGAEVMQEESFGPLVPVCVVEDDEAALQAMNATRFGLTASIWTRDAQRAEKLATRLDVGTVYQNRCDYLDPLLPWTGVHESGKGSSLSRYGLYAFTRRKSLHFRH